MKKSGVFLVFCLVLSLVTAAVGQELELRQLGRAPLSPYLQSPQEVKNLLKKVNEEVGRALDYFPGGALGEATYAALYEQLDQLRLDLVEVQPGQKMIWMMYSRGRLLKGLRWAGAESFQAYKFLLEAEGKEFTFIVPVRCGNIALLEMREAPVKSIPVVEEKKEKPVIIPSAPVQPAPQPQPQPVLTPKPVPTVKMWSPTVKIKVGASWERMKLPDSVDYSTSRFDFFSLVPQGDSVFYCEDGTAMWYYTLNKSTPFAIGQEVPLWRHEVIDAQKGKIFPFYVEVELEIWKNLFIGGSYFQVGKYSFSQYEGKESMVIDEMRLLGEYGSSSTTTCPPTYVYYVGLHRDWNELLIRENVRIQEFTAGIKYQLQLGKNLNIDPEGGILWRVHRGTRITDTTYTKLYPFKEEALTKENCVEVVEKFRTTSTCPYIGLSLELGPLFVQGRRLLSNTNTNILPLEISPWRIQGGILLRF